MHLTALQNNIKVYQWLEITATLQTRNFSENYLSDKNFTLFCFDLLQQCSNVT
jgi:hypothetical protein